MDYDDLEESLDDSELDGDKAKKMERIHRKADDLMAEAAEVFLDDRIREKIERKVLGLLERKKLPPTLNNLKALLLGYQFGTASMTALGNESMSIAVAIRGMIKNREPKIDITKSKPLK